MALNLAQITDELILFGRDPRNYPDVDFQGIVTTRANLPNNSIIFSAEALGNSGSIYTTELQVYQIGYIMKDQIGYIEPESIARIIDPIYVDQNHVGLKCSCSDFRFTFEKELYDNGSLIGNWRRYDREPNSNRPPRNPLNYTGYCKHLWHLIRELMQSGIIRGTLF